LIGFSCGAALAFSSAALRAPASLFVQPAMTSVIALASQMARQPNIFLILAVLIDRSRDLTVLAIIKIGAGDCSPWE
jgi:hypothetical protein